MDRKFSNGEESDLKLISWNIDSLNAALTSDSKRALMTRQVLDQLHALDADVIAIQETKLGIQGPSKKHQALLAERFPNYHYVWRSSTPPARKGYAGTLILYKSAHAPLVDTPKIDAPCTMDEEGRILTLEWPEFYVTTVYTPNAGSELARLPDRMIWDNQYRAYLQKLDAQKPVIACGDFNVAYEAIDLAHPENNHFSAGFTDEERSGFGQLLDAGFSDTFRSLHGPVEGAYTWWAQRVPTSKRNNSGWRIDYFLVSDRLLPHVVASEMIDSGDRQDHAPIWLELNLSGSH